MKLTLNLHVKPVTLLLHLLIQVLTKRVLKELESTFVLMSSCQESLVLSPRVDAFRDFVTCHNLEFLGLSCVPPQISGDPMFLDEKDPDFNPKLQVNLLYNNSYS